jgi:hypothetical protein
MYVRARCCSCVLALAVLLINGMQYVVCRIANPRMQLKASEDQGPAVVLWCFLQYVARAPYTAVPQARGKARGKECQQRFMGT